jgi:hypothetical protein
VKRGMARGTRFKYGLGGTAGTQHTKEELDALVTGVASGDTTFDGAKIAYGQCIITGSRDVQTGLTTVFAGGANINNPKPRNTTLTGQFCNVRIPRNSGGPVSLSKGAGYMKICVRSSTASVEAAVAASVDWFAIGA